LQNIRQQVVHIFKKIASVPKSMFQEKTDKYTHIKLVKKMEG
jgi:hypothetical protein